MPSIKCTITLMSPKPKIFKGKFDPSEQVGTYGFRNQFGFGIPKGVQSQTTAAFKVRAHPHFFVDPETALAQPVGKANVTDKDGKLAAKIEVATQKRYVKGLTARQFDIVQTLIIMAAGGGIILYTLHLIGALTGNAITL